MVRERDKETPRTFVLPERQSSFVRPFVSSAAAPQETRQPPIQKESFLESASDLAEKELEVLSVPFRLLGAGLDAVQKALGTPGGALVKLFEGKPLGEAVSSAYREAPTVGKIITEGIASARELARPTTVEERGKRGEEFLKKGFFQQVVEPEFIQEFVGEVGEAIAEGALLWKAGSRIAKNKVNARVTSEQLGDLYTGRPPRGEPIPEPIQEAIKTTFKPSVKSLRDVRDAGGLDVTITKPASPTRQLGGELLGGVAPKKTTVEMRIPGIKVEPVKTTVPTHTELLPKEAQPIIGKSKAEIVMTPEELARADAAAAQFLSSRNRIPKESEYPLADPGMESQLQQLIEGKPAVFRRVTEDMPAQEQQRVDELFTQLEVAEAGQRIFKEGRFGERIVEAQRSSFPQWLPEELRIGKLVRNVAEHYRRGTFPTSPREIEIYNLVMEHANPEAQLRAVDDFEKTAEARLAIRAEQTSTGQYLKKNIEQTIFDRLTKPQYSRLDLAERIAQAETKAERRGAISQKVLEQRAARRQVAAERRQGRRLVARAKTETREAVVEVFHQRDLTAQAARESVVDYVNANVVPAGRGRFLASVKNAQTPTQVAKTFMRVDVFVQKFALRQAINQLKKEVSELSESSAVSVDYRNKISAIMDEYELSGHSQKTMDRLRATQEYIRAQQKAGEDVEMPQRVLNKLRILGRTPKDQLTFSQVQGLRDEIARLAGLGKTKWSSRQALYEAEKELRTKELMEEATPITATPAQRVPIGEDPVRWMNWYIALRNYLQTSRVALTPIDGLAEVTGMQPMKAALDLSYGGYLSYAIELPTKGNLLDAMERWTEIARKLTEGQLRKIGAFAHGKQSGGVERLQNSGYTAKEIEALVLTPEENAAYIFAREHFDDVFPLVKKYAAEVYNEDVGQVENYVSYMSDYDQMSDLELYDRFGVRAEQAVELRTKTVEQGFRKERAQISEIKLELNIDKIFKRHMDDVAYMLTMGRDIKMYFEIVNTPAMREKLGDTGTLVWLQWLDLMARKGGQDGAKRIAVLDFLRKNVGAGLLGFRLSSVLVQVSSFADSIATIGAEWASRGATSIAISKEWRDFVMDNFPEVRRAVGDDVAFREFNSGYLAAAQRAGLKPLQWMDGLMRSSAAAGAYQKLAAEDGVDINLGVPNRELVQEATRLMRHSQGSSFMKDQPLAISAGFGITENRSVNRALFQFQSFLLNRWENIVRHVWRLGIKKGDYVHAVMSVIWLGIVALAMEESIRRGTRGIINVLTGDDKDEKPFVQQMASGAMRNVPVVGSLMSSITYSSFPAPIISVIEDAIRGVGTVIEGKAPETKLRGLARALGAGGALAGLPGSSQLAQIISKAIPEVSSKKSIRSFTSQ